MKLPFDVYSDEDDYPDGQQGIFPQGLPGELPLPESYNFCAMQLRLAKDTDSSWSMEWPIYAIKKIVEVDKPGFLHHGQTYTFFRKKYAGYPDTYDLVLMPPLVIQNCLPVDF